MDTLLQDIRYGFRTLLKTPGFTLIAVLSLALGIGANTAIFSIIDALMLRQLPVRQPERLVSFGDGQWAGVFGGIPGQAVDIFSEPQLAAIREKNEVFEDVCGEFSFRFVLHPVVPGAAASDMIEARAVTGNFFSVLGVAPAAGRLFTSAEDQPLKAHADMVISYAWWKRRFGANPNVIGQTVRIASRNYTIIGVTAPEFFGASVGEAPDAWLPISMLSEFPPYMDFHNANLVQTSWAFGRLKPGVTIAQASANVNLLFQQLLRSYVGQTPSKQDLDDIAKTRIVMTPAAAGFSRLRSQFSLSLRILMAVVAMVLLIACANVANLLLARATARQKEMAIRAAVGSGRVRLLRQLLTESLLLSLAGGAVGILVAMWGSQLLLRMVSIGLDAAILNVDPNLRILGFTFGVSLLTGILFGIAPAFRGSSVDLGPTLKEGRGGTANRSRVFAGRALVVSQVALSLLLVIGAGLFVRSFGNLERINTGFDRENVLAVSEDMMGAGFKQDEHLASVYRRIEDRVAQIPGVQSAAFSMFAFGPGNMSLTATVEGHPEVAQQKQSFQVKVTGQRYVETMEMPVLNGRAFRPQDTASAPKVALINEKAAHAIFGGESPIGKHFGFGDAKTAHDIEIVGVVTNAKYETLQEETPWVVYLPYTQRSEYLGYLMLRTQGPSAPIMAQVRRAFAEVEPNLPIMEITTMTDMVDRTLVTERVIAQLSTFFGGLALLLAAIGLYGILSYSVARRTNEIGVRMALGAQSTGVLWMILRETLLLVGVGALIGIPAALVCSRYIESLLYGLPANDALTMGAAVVMLGAIGSMAGLLPARRASQIDPMVALRYE
jgi:predicted permease